MEKHGTGLLESPYDIRDFSLSMRSSNTDNLPEEFDLGVLKIKDQGDESTCAAHAVSELIEYHNYHQNNNQYKEFSTEFIYGAREEDYYLGEGMYLREALKIAQKRGDVEKYILPGNHNVEKAMAIVKLNKNYLF